MSISNTPAVGLTQTFEPNERFMRLTEVVKVTGFSRSQIYRLMNRGEFPRAIPLGPCTVAWLQSQVYAWVREKIERATNGASASQ